VTLDIASSSSSSPLTATDVVGCLSLPEDVLAESSPLPPLSPGNILAFPNTGAYGFWASAIHFHGFAPPPEIAFDGEMLHVMREPQSSRSILKGQNHIVRRRATEVQPRNTRSTRNPINV
jgi:hypothetical protein